jgi:hypothetical protein
MPANFYGAEFGVDAWLAWGNNVWLGAEAEGVLEREFAFEEAF